MTKYTIQVMSRINDLVYPVISLNARPPPMPRELIIRVSVEEEMPNGYYLQIPPGAYL